MPELSQLTKPEAVEAAISECLELGRDEFLQKYGYQRARSYFLVSKGHLLDSKAVLGVAFRYQFGVPLQPADFSGGERSAVRILVGLGFRVDKASSWIEALTRDVVEQEILRFDTLGRSVYLDAYGGGEAAKFFIDLAGNRYDAKAVLVCALRSVTGISGISHHEIEGTETAVAEPLRALGFTVIADWPFSNGQTLARKAVHSRVGGNRERVISTISGCSDVLIFSDPKRGRRYGYDRFEGFRDDGSFWYTGEGTTGDQSLESSGNRAILEADKEGLRLRLFVTEGTMATYMGEVVTGDPPFEWRRAPDKDGVERDVVVFHFVPVSRLVTPKVALPSVQPTTTWSRPADGEYTVAGALINGRVVSRQEMNLQGRYGLWLQGLGRSVLRRPVVVPSTGIQVFPDLFDDSTCTVVEAKKSAAREYVREAIGQVLDYRNLLMLDGLTDVRAAILLPAAPEADLVMLCRGLSIAVVVPDGDGFTEL